MRKVTGERRALVVWIDKTADEALLELMRTRGYTVKRDAVQWALVHAANCAAAVRP